MYLEPWALFNDRKPRPPTDRADRPGVQTASRLFWCTDARWLRQINICVTMMCVSVCANIFLHASAFWAYEKILLSQSGHRTSPTQYWSYNFLCFSLRNSIARVGQWALEKIWFRNRCIGPTISPVHTQPS